VVIDYKQTDFCQSDPEIRKIRPPDHACASTASRPMP
jgi:hypothetical protein